MLDPSANACTRFQNKRIDFEGGPDDFNRRHLYVNVLGTLADKDVTLTQPHFRFIPVQADVHIMAETTRAMLTDPFAYQMHLSFEKTAS